MQRNGGIKVDRDIFVSRDNLEQRVAQLLDRNQFLRGFRETRFNRVAEPNRFVIARLLDAEKQFSKLDGKFPQADAVSQIAGNDFPNFTGGCHD